MGAKKKHTAGFPSKKLGMKSGKDRENNPPKSSGGSRRPMTPCDAKRIKDSKTTDRGFVQRAEKAVIRIRAVKLTHRP